MAKKKELDREKLSWYLRLITLGDRFSYQDFFDRFKKGFVEFLIVFFGVLVSFSVEQQGENFGDRESNIDNLIGLRDELIDMHEYTLEYIDQNELITGLYEVQYQRWDQDNDSVFDLVFVQFIHIEINDIVDFFIISEVRYHFVKCRHSY